MQQLVKHLKICKESNANCVLIFSYFLYITGPFLSNLLKKLQTFTSNCIYVNLQLTGLISHLARYPLPLIHSILLRPDIPTTSDTPSFHQVLKILKEQIDAELPVIEESLEYIDTERTNLIEREIYLTNARKNESETYGSASTSVTTPLQLTPSSTYDPFRRIETKRKSITHSFSNIFRRTSSHVANNKSTTGNLFHQNIIYLFSLRFSFLRFYLYFLLPFLLYKIIMNLRLKSHCYSFYAFISIHLFYLIEFQTIK